MLGFIENIRIRDFMTGQLELANFLQLLTGREWSLHHSPANDFYSNITPDGIKIEMTADTVRAAMQETYSGRWYKDRISSTDVKLLGEVPGLQVALEQKSVLSATPLSEGHFTSLIAPGTSDISPDSVRKTHGSGGPAF